MTTPVEDIETLKMEVYRLGRRVEQLEADGHHLREADEKLRSEDAEIRSDMPSECTCDCESELSEIRHQLHSAQIDFKAASDSLDNIAESVDAVVEKVRPSVSEEVIELLQSMAVDLRDASGALHTVSEIG